ncbi:hypothetical protein ACFVZJ_31475 [Streptomyces sp. NPDC058322]
MHRRELDRRLETAGKLLVSRRDSPVLLKAADAALHRVAGLVILAIEGRP